MKVKCQPGIKIPKLHLAPITWIKASAGKGSNGEDILVPALTIDDYKKLGENMQLIIGNMKSKNEVIEFYQECNR